MKNKIAIITGVSRTQGIGAAIANKLAENSIDIFFSYWKPYDKSMPWSIEDNEPEQIRSSILSKNVRCECYELDLSLPTSPKQLIEYVHANFGEPDILINNATYSTNNSYMDITFEELDKHYFVNIRATMLLCAEFARRYNKQSIGKIINLSSGQFKGPMIGEIAYSTTKGAVDALTISLSGELASKNITVNSVNPGCTDSGWIPSEQKESFIKLFPFGRIGQPKDAANLINFLASDDSDWITGQLLHSEGGFIR